MNTVPYCGPAPLPDGLWSAWNLDPAVLAGLALASLFALSQPDRSARRAGIGAVLLLAVAFVSPLCALASALFSARVAHHLVIVAGAAPLIAHTLVRRSVTPRGGEAAFVVHTVLLWLWHTPGPYGFALSSTPAYWLMEATLTVSAVWFWHALLSPRTAPGTTMALALGAIVQMGMLGALLTFAGRPLFAEHALTTAPFGLTPLEDQQLAGLLMWVPAALPYLAVALHRLFALLGGAARGDARP
ncbi:cytochrome c oxidase assembly protein [Azospirillum doebereinerae]|uniref:Cytochrome c oxidase assembly protein n=1 Tax=Azospirillum doebereinerae TaxID=92933 RepID=A0A3S0WVW1_9PROT|nr:cytochrome c oxidase assembly protein [Azospirillum doebereinerae]RUQ65121.1 cytochrome c oxidase assembly protein [Azospirillum doebereinerae]